jgi:chemotaxis protein methyltransferase CheR
MYLRYLRISQARSKSSKMAFTFFFRDQQTLELAVAHTLPLIVGRSRGRVWDAGCASGQEPYSLAILFAEKIGPFGFRNLRIDATDLDESGHFEELISQGCYSLAELERIPAELRQKYFELYDGGCMRVAGFVRERIRFRRHNLLSLEPIGEGFALIVCKNVLLHFNQQQRVDVLRMFHRALEPNGCLVMEQTQKLPPGMELLFTQLEPSAQLFARIASREGTTLAPPKQGPADLAVTSAGPAASGDAVRPPDGPAIGIDWQTKGLPGLVPLPDSRNCRVQPGTSEKL